MISSFMSRFNHFLTLKPPTSLPHHYTIITSFHTRLFSCKGRTFISNHSRLLSSAPHISTFMELVKEIASWSPESQQNIVIKDDQKCCSYLQLISYAGRIHDQLTNLHQKNGDSIQQKDLGGARIGIVAKPCAEFVAGILGTWLCGGVAVPLALSYPETELLHVMNDSDISMILSTEDHREIMTSVAAKTGAQLSFLPTIPISSTDHTQLHNESNGGKRVLQFEFSQNVQGEDPALILYTSGTTGRPKGVVHTHTTVLAQVQMLTNAWEYTSNDYFLHCLPLHHVHGLFNALFAPIYAGSKVEFMPKFRVRGIWQRWRESYPIDGSKSDDAITVFTGVPTMYTRLIQGYEAMDTELQTASASAARHLRLMMCGSSALPLPVMQQWETITGHRLLERYGMTEFVMAISNPLRGQRKGGTVGKPFAVVQAKLLSEDVNSDDKTGVGELCIKSPSLFKGYWKLPEVTKESFTDDGFFKTGDAARIDEDGYYIILGRTNADIMKVGGYKLSALEIEAVLLEHPVISECCVLGLPDKDYGEVVCAIVVLDADLKQKREAESKPALTLQELCDWAKEKLAPYKIPSRFYVWDSLPRNAMGKVNKKELKRNFSDGDN
ncbi:malonate--CoA ligase [Ipomoea triloba]|uniref:malonate--CoA ligase n=1 Tax=Ipomoea triloba TaxID=35885 RepID=UPI00125D754C|nr:malonate--CoA ligase [Ipomoea triloba]